MLGALTIVYGLISNSSFDFTLKVMLGALIFSLEIILVMFEFWRVEQAKMGRMK